MPLRLVIPARQTPPRPRALLLAPLLALLLATLAGCSERAKKQQPPQPWTFRSAKAPYTLTLPPTWRQVPVETYHNPHADLAARGPASLAMLVIPQRLDIQDESERPDALRLRDAGVQQMKAKIEGFALTRKGPMFLGGAQGQVVYARGTSEDQPVRYIVAYTRQADWAFQIVAWSLDADTTTLEQEVDRALRTWTFTASTSPTPTPTPTPDAASQAAETPPDAPTP